MNQSIQTGVKYAAGAVVLFLVFKAYGLINFANNAFVSFKSFRLSGSFLNPEFYITLTVSNPTSEQVTVNSIIGQLLYNQNKVADVFSQVTIVIPKYGAENIDIRMSANVTDWLAIFTAAINKNLQGNIFFNGTVTINSFSLPVNINLI